jgi:DNA-directed RNA polymerase subunit M/transcription elongation factor TFIIS
MSSKFAPAPRQTQAPAQAQTRNSAARRERPETTSTTEHWTAPLSVASKENTAQLSHAFRLRATRLLWQTVKSLDVARRIERCVFEGAVVGGIAYGPKITQLAENLRQNADRLLSQYAVDTLAFLDDRSLCQGTPTQDWWDAHTEKLAHELKVMSDKDEYEREEQDNADLAASTLVCSRCHSKTIKIDQKQTRGADEAMTVFCTCQCGNRWRM